MKLAMRVTVSGASELTKAYTSVLSADGSFEISGASRCDDISGPSALGRAREGTRQASDQSLVLDHDFVSLDHQCHLAFADVVDVGGHRPMRTGRQDVVVSGAGTGR